MIYQAYEMSRAALYPWRQMSTMLDALCAGPLAPWSTTPMGRYARASAKLFLHLTRRYGKPAYGIHATTVDGRRVPVRRHSVLSLPFCELLHFERELPPERAEQDPKVLLVAPMSGHYATLLRGTIRTFLPEHEVYVTDWRDARDVPLVSGRFDLDDYVDYLMQFCRALGPELHVVAVCQPSVPALEATALLAATGDPACPRSLTLMAGPVDSRRSPTRVNEHAGEHGLDWFRRNVISTVPMPHPGFLRPVYPGFLQLSGFLALNLDRHIDAYRGYFENLVAGDDEGTRQHDEFYEEYLAVMDLTAEFFLQTVDEVFQRHTLARGTREHRGVAVDCTAIRETALMTVEGGRDDICGIGQTEAAHALCEAVPGRARRHLLHPRVGHYGVFNGRRWREEIYPEVRRFIREAARGRTH